MTWREHILSIIIPIFLWVLLVWLGTTIGSYIRDAKKWRDHEWRESRFGKSKGELYNEIDELEKRIKELEDDKIGENAILDEYIAYTGIYPREIGDKLEKRERRKKRK